MTSKKVNDYIYHLCCYPPSAEVIEGYDNSPHNFVNTTMESTTWQKVYALVKQINPTYGCKNLIRPESKVKLVI